MAQPLPRLPLEGFIDLTYRCNNQCRHCWLWQPSTIAEQQRELSFEEWRGVVDQARALGTRQWALSGGEPMLRADFAELFEYVTRKCISYTLNTNGTLITPEIARLLTRKGAKLVALYGATADVYDHVTRNPGGFEAAMRGFRYLQEAGAGFTVQLIPMRDNYHQWNEMIALAQSQSPHYRLGASWLYLSADGDPVKNAEIARQRLDPATVVALDAPIPREDVHASHAQCGMGAAGDDRLYAGCIAGKRSFHVDPYGGMSFCTFIKDPALRYDVRQGTVREAWDQFIPSIADMVRGGEEYRQQCGGCTKRRDCCWCPVYGHLEHGRHSAKVGYLCSVTEEVQRFKTDWAEKHRRYFKIAGITIQVESDLPISDETFAKKFEAFRVDGPGEDTVVYRHHFSSPQIDRKKLGKEVYRKPPWVIHHREGAWTYQSIASDGQTKVPYRVVTANEAHTRVHVYHEDHPSGQQGGWHSLSMLATDQIPLGYLLPQRDACYLHAAGAIMQEQGLLFVGHSSAGKTTITRMIADQAEILCDDRIIIRRWPEGFRVHGTWSHGDSPLISAADAPLSALLFLEQSTQNCLAPLTDRQEILRRLLPCVIKPMVTVMWWEKVLTLLERLLNEVPCYRMLFDKSGSIVPLLPPVQQKIR